MQLLDYEQTHLWIAIYTNCNENIRTDTRSKKAIFYIIYIGTIYAVHLFIVLGVGVIIIKAKLYLMSLLKNVI